MKKAFVTGATGFTGSYLCKELIAAGYQVKALIRKGSKRQNLEGLPIEYIEGDLASPETLRGLIRNVDYVYHIAALYRQEGISRQMFNTVNVDAVRVLLEESAKAGVNRFIHCSTVGVQGEIKNPPASETAPFNPGDHYQQSKLDGELLALEFFKSGKLDGVVVRPVGIYGPGDTRFLKLFKSIYRNSFRMIGSGKVLYHLTYVEDLVRGIRLAGETPAASGQVYTIGGKEYLPLGELASLIGEIMGKKISRLHIPLWPVYLAAILCEWACRPFGIEPPLYRRRLDFFTKSRAFDISKARKELGYSPRISLREGVTRTAIWYKDHHWFE